MHKASLIILLLLGGCMNRGTGIRPLRPLQIPLAQYRQVETEARTGSLMYESNCLLFHDEKTGAIMLPVWTVGTIFNGTAVIFHQPGRTDQRILVAEEFVMSGEPMPETMLAAPAYRSFQQQCAGYPLFYVSAVRPAD